MDSHKPPEFTDGAKAEDGLAADEEIVEAAREPGSNLGPKALEGALLPDESGLTNSQLAEAKYRLNRKSIWGSGPPIR